MSRSNTQTDGVPAERPVAPRDDRRFWQRYPARGLRATLTWLEGAADKTIQGELMNVGGEGASFISDAAPPPDVPLWLRLEIGERRDGRIDPVESRLVETADSSSGTNVAHLRFVAPCPMELFNLTVHDAE